MPLARAGVAAAIASTGRQVGIALGVAIIGAVLASSAAGSADAGDAGRAGGHAGWWIICGLGATVLALGRLSTGRRAQASAHDEYDLKARSRSI